MLSPHAIKTLWITNSGINWIFLPGLGLKKAPCLLLIRQRLYQQI